MLAQPIAGALDLHDHGVVQQPIQQRRGDHRVAELLALQADYAAWADVVPEGLRDTATAEALQAMVDLDLDTLAEIEPPRGYGRD